MRRNDNLIPILLLAGAGGVILYQYLKQKGLLTVNTPGSVNNSGSGNVLIGEARGIRNNNPGNIKYNPINNWQGAVDQDGPFVKFTSPQYGIRAMFKVLKTYIEANKLDTIEKISARWTATDQSAWKANVARFAGIPQNAPINYADKALMMRVANGIVVAENGSKYNGYYSSSVISGAYDAA